MLFFFVFLFPSISSLPADEPDEKDSLDLIHKELGEIRQQIEEQGQMIKALYKYANLHGDLEEEVEEELRKQELEEQLKLEPTLILDDENLTSMAQFSPIEASFAVMRGDGQIHILDFKGNIQERIKYAGDTFTCFAYSPDGKRILTGTETGKIVWYDLQNSGESTFVYSRPGVDIDRVCCLGDTNRIAWGTSMKYESRKDGKVNGGVLDLKTGEELWTFSAFIRNDFQTLAGSPDGSQVAVLDPTNKPRGAYLLAADTGIVSATLVHQRFQSGPLSVCVAPDNQHVAVGYGPYSVIFWDSVKQEAVKILEGHTNWVVSLAFSPDGKRLISGAGDSTARVWDLESGEEIGRIRFEGGSTYIDSVGFSPDGKSVLAATEGYLLIANAPD